MKLRIGILGTRGIPNSYGGFEQFAEYLSAGLVARRHEVFVYNSHHHPYKDKTWNNVHIIHCYDPEDKLGTAGQFIYDFNCVADARKRRFDVLLILGFTSCSVWGQMFPKDAAVIINMDGMEWQRAKYKAPIRKFLRYAEKLAVKHGDYFIADSPVIQSYLQKEYDVPSVFIPYGAEIFNNEDESLLGNYHLQPYNYFMLMARLEPENNIEMILDGFAASNSSKTFLVIGKTSNKHGAYLCEKFRGDKRIKFIGAVYNNPTLLHTLKYYAALYFHGHGVGGTNPSLLEAMASRVLIAAHNNPFNEAILQNDAFYFSNPAEVKQLVENSMHDAVAEQMIKNNLEKIASDFNWKTIIDKYEAFMLQCSGKEIREKKGTASSL